MYFIYKISKKTSVIFVMNMKNQEELNKIFSKINNENSDLY